MLLTVLTYIPIIAFSSMPIIFIYYALTAFFNLDGSPLSFFIGVLTNTEFKTMLELIFNDPEAEAGYEKFVGGGYVCEGCKSFSTLTINNEKKITPYQKMLFFRRLKRWQKQQYTPPKDLLHKDKINEILFNKKLESMLDREKQ